MRAAPVISRREHITASPTHVAVYGSLRKGGGIGDEPDLSEHLRPAGAAIVEGRLVDLGQYPGLVPGSGRVRAELYEIIDPGVLRVLDRHERYDSNDPRGSLYLRRAVRLIEPRIDAWVYIYNGQVGDVPEVVGGDWIKYTTSGVLVRIEGRTSGGMPFVAGLDAVDGRVVHTAPILHFMRGWDGVRVAAYCARRGWTWTRHPFG